MRVYELSSNVTLKRTCILLAAGVALTIVDVVVVRG